MCPWVKYFLETNVRVKCVPNSMSGHMSRVTCHIVVELVGGGSVINGAYPVYLKKEVSINKFLNKKEGFNDIAYGHFHT